MFEHPHKPRGYPYADNVVGSLFNALEKRPLP